jgi:hypothetical protein
MMSQENTKNIPFQEYPKVVTREGQDPVTVNNREEEDKALVRPADKGSGEPKMTVESLSKLNKGDLISLAKARFDLELDESSKKDELIEYILEAQKE